MKDETLIGYVVREEDYQKDVVASLKLIFYSIALSCISATFLYLISW